MRALLLSVFVLLTCVVKANNVTISGVSTIVTASATQIKFNLAWSNSWRTSTLTQNWDAVWIFIKYKDNGVWKHLDLTGNDNIAPAGFSITVPADKKGAFIYRSANGTGNVSLTNVKLGVVPVAGSFNIQVFAIEMVYVPEGNFYIGDGAAVGAFKRGGQPAHITSTAANTIKGYSVGDDTQLKVNGISIDGDGGLDTDNNGTIDNPNYPIGYKSLYCMKYEISQRGYCDFLNTLTYNQQAGCTKSVTSPPNSSIGTSVLDNSSIKVEIPGINNTKRAIYGLDGDNDNIFNEATDAEWKAIQLPHWKYVCSYLDWAALRPMTELEFEKICRGPNAPVANEFAWGTSAVVLSPYTITSPGTNNEVASNASTSGTIGNAYHSGTIGPESSLRNGIFATSSSGRIQSGAAYYGVMEMSGNITEAVVTVGNAAGRSYTGKVGNGALNIYGNADVDYWPGINGNTNNALSNSVYGGATGVTALAGAGSRGIGFSSTGGAEMQASNRFSATVGNTINYGGRGVRQEPYEFIELTDPISTDSTCYKICNMVSPSVYTNQRIEITQLNNVEVFNINSACSGNSVCAQGNAYVVTNLKPFSPVGVRMFNNTTLLSTGVFIAGNAQSYQNCIYGNCSGSTTILSTDPKFVLTNNTGMCRPKLAVPQIISRNLGASTGKIKLAWIYRSNFTTPAATAFTVEAASDDSFSIGVVSTAVAASNSLLHTVEIDKIYGSYFFRITGADISNVVCLVFDATTQDLSCNNTVADTAGCF